MSDDEVLSPEIQLVQVEIGHLRERIANLCEVFYPSEDMRQPLAKAVRSLPDNDRGLWRVWSAEGRVPDALLQDLMSVVLFAAISISDDPALELFFDDQDAWYVMAVSYSAGTWDALGHIG